VFAAPDYRELYFELFRASEEAARLLREAQLRAEQQVMDDDPPPLHLSPDTKKAGDGQNPSSRPDAGREETEGD